jgi:hypothetical protein
MTLMLWLTLVGVVVGQTSLDQATASLEYAQANQAFIETELEMAEADLKAAEETLARQRQLFSHGLIARKKMEQAEAAMRDEQERVELLRQQQAIARQIVVQAEKEVELAKTRSDQKPLTSVTRVARHYGRGAWNQQDFDALARAYRQRFDQELPISALGQTPTHDRLGFNHRQRMDVAVHPDSSEGRWIMEYLRGQGIPFIAFRTHVSGCATGAHIHVGLPSSRL